MSTLYENLLKATDNTADITVEKYGVITKLDGLYCSVKETDNDLEHSNVPILNGLNVELGDTVIIGFINNSIHDVICYGGVGSKRTYSKEEIDKIVEDIVSGQIDLSGYMKWTDYTNDLGNQTDNSEFLKGLDNLIVAITGRGDL